LRIPQTLKTLAAGALALGLALFAGAGSVQATTFNWTNTTGAVYGDPVLTTRQSAARVEPLTSRTSPVFRAP